MRVSVIIPVYNAAAYVRQAVESALAQPETAEVILVEDGSTDNTLAVCQRLADEYPIVRLYRHPDASNHGVSATSNLGILRSTGEYISILAADDFFLPDRFVVAREMFASDPNLEGVYEAVGRHIEDERGAQRWKEAGFCQKELATMGERVPAEELFAALVSGRSSGFLLAGSVVRRSVFTKTGLFDEHLDLHQDTAMICKMAAAAKLVAGRLEEPVALARIHGHNRISAPRPQSEVYKMKMMLWTTLWYWSKENLDQERQQLVLDRLLDRAMFIPRFDRIFPAWTRGFQKRVQLALLVFDHPSLLWQAAYWKRFVPSLRYWSRCFLGLSAQGR
jgi:glycosyltransferase involved in cell wall biosynthesis